MKTTIKMTKRSNWVSGTYNGMKYEAKIYTEPSTFGINAGHVSKLWIKGASLEVNYDRGWDIGQDKQAIWGPLVETLNRFAKTAKFAEALGMAVAS